MGRRAALPLVLAAVALTACGSKPRPRPAQTPAPSAAPAGETDAAVTASGLDEHLDALQEIADAHGGTRAAGTPGDEATVDYIAAQLRQAGWRVRTPAFEDPVFVERRPPRLVLGGRRGGAGHLRTLAYSPGGSATGRVRAVQLRLGHPSDSGCRRRDYGRVRRGEVVLVQRGTCFLAVKARLAAGAGASAVLIANDGTPGNTGAFSGT